MSSRLKRVKCLVALLKRRSASLHAVPGRRAVLARQIPDRLLDIRRRVHLLQREELELELDFVADLLLQFACPAGGRIGKWARVVEIDINLYWHAHELFLPAMRCVPASSGKRSQARLTAARVSSRDPGVVDDLIKG